MKYVLKHYNLMWPSWNEQSTQCWPNAGQVGTQPNAPLRDVCVPYEDNPAKSSHLFLHYLCVLNLNLSDNILYLVSFTFILAKHKKATHVDDNMTYL